MKHRVFAFLVTAVAILGATMISMSARADATPNSMETLHGRAQRS